MTNKRSFKITKLGKGNWSVIGSENEIKELVTTCLKRDIEIVEKSNTEILITTYENYRKIKMLNLL